jgi:hypothetical protein
LDSFECTVFGIIVNNELKYKNGNLASLSKIVMLKKEKGNFAGKHHGKRLLVLLN